MANEVTKHLEQLKQAYDSGILDWDTYQAALAGFTAQPAKPTEAAGERSVAVGKDIRESTVITGNNNIIQIVQALVFKMGCPILIGYEWKKVHLSWAAQNVGIDNLNLLVH
jgi:hypothetical protein